MSLIYWAMSFEKPVCSHKIISADWGESYRVLECTGYHFSLVGGLRRKNDPAGQLLWNDIQGYAPGSTYLWTHVQVH